MDADETPKLNPYAPSTLSSMLQVEPSDEAHDAFPESGIDFAGTLDLRSVRESRQGALAFGTSERPLLRFDWMQGPVGGTVGPNRLDIRWNEGESEGSLTFPAMSTYLDFSNRHGRLFVIHGLPCFIPQHAIAPGLWPYVEALRPRPSKSEERPLRQPPEPADETAICWPSSVPSFADDCARHDYLCADPAFSRALFLLGLAIVALLLLVDSLRIVLAIIMTSTLVATAGLFWVMREGMRRNWWSTNIVSVPESRRGKFDEPPPGYLRWIDQDRLLIGFHDAWICVPWSAVNHARISPYAIEFSFTPLGLDAWYLERGDHSEQQWRNVIDLIRRQPFDVSVWGAVRR